MQARFTSQWRTEDGELFSFRRYGELPFFPASGDELSFDPFGVELVRNAAFNVEEQLLYVNLEQRSTYRTKDKLISQMLQQSHWILV